MNKIIKLFGNPLILYSLLKDFYLSNFYRKKTFAHNKELRSKSEDGIYSNTILKFLQSQNKFDNFKRNYSYRKFLEHVTEKEGLEYLKILEGRDDGFPNKGLNTVLISDAVGNPIKKI